MRVNAETLTPLWTGGVQTGRVDRIHETSILGSMRWWYESIVRGLGGQCCDPSHSKCAFDEKKSSDFENSQNLLDTGLCDACKVFGATGWRRRFKLIIHETDIHPDDRINNVKIYRDGGSSRWFFPEKLIDKPRSGKFDIEIVSMASDFPPEVITGLMQFIADWTGIGARTQMGFGIIKLRNGRFATQPICDWLDQVKGSQIYPNMPSLQNIFFARLSPKDGRGFEEKETFNLKYNLRRIFADDMLLRHFLMGTTAKGGKMAAKVKMSYPYNDSNEIRVWGWIPEELQSSENHKKRDAVVKSIFQELEDKYTIQIWREMNSSRDTVIANNNNAMVFLQSLLGLEGGTHA